MGRHHRRTVPLIPIASPLAGHRLTKKIGGLIAKCAEGKKLIYGVKDTGKALRKDEQGICVLGGNVSPMDVITHIPGLCEYHQVPYVFFPTKEQISAYAQRTTAVACVVIPAPGDADYRDEYIGLVEEIRALGTSEQQEE